MRDIKSILARELRGNLPGVFVDEKYPQWDDLSLNSIDKAICLVQVPGGAEVIPWGGGTVGLDAYAVEVHIVAPDTATCLTLAQPVRDIILSMPITGVGGAVNVLEPVGFCDSDDLNPDFVHMQAEYTIVCHA